MQQSLAQLNAQPGISILTTERRWGKWDITALADPTAGDVSALLDQQQINPEKIRLSLIPFLSLEPEMALKRIVSRWKIPAEVSAKVEHGILILRGTAPVAWYIGLRKKTLLPYGIDAVDTSQITLDTVEVAQYLEEKIGFPGSIKIETHPTNLKITGNTTKSWINQLESEIQLIDNKINFSLETLKSQ